MHTSESERKKLLGRIRRIKGQVTALETSLANDASECADMLLLLAAVRGGINGLMAEILENHIRFHLLNPGTQEISGEDLTSDLITLVRAYLK